MKITAIRGIMLRCTCSPISDALSTSTARQALLVKSKPMLDCTESVRHLPMALRLRL